MRGQQVHARAGGNWALLRDPRLLPGTRHLHVGDPLFKAAVDTTTLLNFDVDVSCRVSSAQVVEKSPRQEVL